MPANENPESKEGKPHDPGKTPDQPTVCVTVSPPHSDPCKDDDSGKSVTVTVTTEIQFPGPPHQSYSPKIDQPLWDLLSPSKTLPGARRIGELCKKRRQVSPPDVQYSLRSQYPEGLARGRCTRLDAKLSKQIDGVFFYRV